MTSTSFRVRESSRETTSPSASSDWTESRPQCAVEVTFDIDANGIVNVSAKDLGTGKEQHITITAGSNMSDEDIEKAIKEAAQFEAEDRKRKEGVDARNEADSIVFQTEKALKEVGDKIDASAKATVESEIADLKAILERTKDQTDISDADIDALKSGKEKLMNDSQQLFTQMYQNMQNNQGAGPDMGGQNAGGSTSGDDDVVDGDYREV